MDPANALSAPAGSLSCFRGFLMGSRGDLSCLTESLSGFRGISEGPDGPAVARRNTAEALPGSCFAPGEGGGMKRTEGVSDCFKDGVSQFPLG